MIKNIPKKKILKDESNSFDYSIVHKFTLVHNEADDDDTDELPQQYKYYKDFNDILLENICTIDDISAYKINKFKYIDEDITYLPISQIIC